jgi:hypothetical protein
MRKAIVSPQNKKASDSSEAFDRVEVETIIIEPPIE